MPPAVEEQSRLPGKSGVLLVKEHRVSTGDDEKVLEMDGGDGCTTM